MRLVESSCDAEVRLVRLGAATTSERSLWLGLLAPATTYAALDGAVTLTVRGAVVFEDQPVRSSKSTTTLAAIKSFVWQGIKPAIKRYRRSSEPR